MKAIKTALSLFLSWTKLQKGFFQTLGSWPPFSCNTDFRTVVLKIIFLFFWDVNLFKSLLLVLQPRSIFLWNLEAISLKCDCEAISCLPGLCGRGGVLPPWAPICSHWWPPHRTTLQTSFGSTSPQMPSGTFPTTHPSAKSPSQLLYSTGLWVKIFGKWWKTLKLDNSYMKSFFFLLE